jgi:hypothetical protein
MSEKEEKPKDHLTVEEIEIVREMIKQKMNPGYGVQSKEPDPVDTPKNG